MKDLLSESAMRKLLAAAEPLLDEPSRESTREGQRIGKYRVIRELGRGGMGVVYEAEDVELRRRVALKVIATQPGSASSARERFLREAQSAARLNHPNIAAVYDASDDAIAMQLVAGEPLSRFPRTDRRLLVRLVRDAALAVDYAHEHGIVHRDLKPQNLLVEGERVVVTDFGLAKEIAVDSSLSLSGHVVGTPVYLSPEQAEGRAADVDARSDVYGLGATLYEVLAGRPPFVERDLVKLLRCVTSEEPPRLRSLAPDVPRDLETIVLKCLEKERDRRYPTAKALADDLSRWLRGEPVLARRPSIVYRAGKLVRRHRALVGLAVVSAVAILVALGLTMNERSQRRASTEALRLSELVATVLEDVKLHVLKGEKEEARDRLEEGIAACRDYLARHDVGRAAYLLGRLLAMRGHVDEAKIALDRALELEPDLPEAKLARGVLLSASLFTKLSRETPPLSAEDPLRLDAESRALRDRALADLSVVDTDAARLRKVDVSLGRAERSRLLGDRAAARRGFEEARRLDATNPAAVTALSELEILEGNGDAAFGLAMSALDLYRGFGPAYLARAAAAEGSADDVGRAARQHELAAADQRVEAGDASTEALHLRASARLHVDDVDGALADFTAALESDPRDALAHGNRAMVHARRAARLASLEKREAALEAWDAAIQDLTSAYTIEPTLVGALNNRGVCHVEKERLLDELNRSSEADAERAAAGADFDAAVRQAPRFALALQNHAMQLRRLAEARARRQEIGTAIHALDRAEADLARVLELCPEDADAILERALVADLRANLHGIAGELREADGWRRRAEADFDAAVKLAPRAPRPLGLRGVHRARHGDEAGGASDLREALRQSPDPRFADLLREELRRLDASPPAPSNRNG